MHYFEIALSGALIALVATFALFTVVRATQWAIRRRLRRGMFGAYPTIEKRYFAPKRNPLFWWGVFLFVWALVLWRYSLTVFPA